TALACSSCRRRSGRSSGPGNTCLPFTCAITGRGRCRTFSFTGPRPFDEAAACRGRKRARCRRAPGPRSANPSTGSPEGCPSGLRLVVQLLRHLEDLLGMVLGDERLPDVGEIRELASLRRAVHHLERTGTIRGGAVPDRAHGAVIVGAEAVQLPV